MSLPCGVPSVSVSRSFESVYPCALLRAALTAFSCAMMFSGPARRVEMNGVNETPPLLGEKVAVLEMRFTPVEPETFTAGLVVSNVSVGRAASGTGLLGENPMMLSTTKSPLGMAIG